MFHNVRRANWPLVKPSCVDSSVPGCILRRTTDGACATFHPAVDFSDEGQGGIYSLGLGRDRRLYAWFRGCATRRLQRAISTTPRTSLGPTSYQRTGTNQRTGPSRKWIVRGKALGRRCQAQGHGSAHGGRYCSDHRPSQPRSVPRWRQAMRLPRRYHAKRQGLWRAERLLPARRGFTALLSERCDNSDD